MTILRRIRMIKGIGSYRNSTAWWNLTVQVRSSIEKFRQIQGGWNPDRTDGRWCRHRASPCFGTNDSMVWRNLGMWCFKPLWGKDKGYQRDGWIVVLGLHRYCTLGWIFGLEKGIHSSSVLAAEVGVPG